MPKDFLILQVRVADTVERKVEKYGNCASAHVYHAELKAFLHMHGDTADLFIHS